MCESGEPAPNPPRLRSFLLPTALQIPRSVLELSCLLVPKKSKQIVTASVAGHVELVVSRFMSTVDKRLSCAFSDKGNATVTFNSPRLRK